ncbi:Tetratricopeptide repeat-domain-containing protein [Aspergillus cavernicola]|uniref:Tetratricopeptide repeat-domain-containing protein n=1 Tax=Aspergillus cavernicola TaxID=176166 RepID=A0ABR4IIL0_9EURO
MEYSDPRERIRPLIRQAIDLGDEGAWGKSNEVLLETLQICNQHLGADHARTHIAQLILAFNYRAQGRYRESEELDREVLAQRRRRLGEDHVETAKCLNNLALDLKGLGREEEALYLEKEALGIMIRVEGEEAQTTMTSMNNLANSYSHHGRYEEAAELHGRVLESRRRVFNRDDPLVIMSMDLLAVDYRSLGQVDRAIELQERAVEIAKTSLGEGHQTTVKCIINLTDTYAALGTEEALDRSVSLLEHALASFQMPDQEDNPLTIGLMNNLAAAYTRVDRLHDAKRLLEFCYHWNRKMLGPEHPRTRLSSDNLIWVLGELEEVQMSRYASERRNTTSHQLF